MQKFDPVLLGSIIFKWSLNWSYKLKIMGVFKNNLIRSYLDWENTECDSGVSSSVGRTRLCFVPRCPCTLSTRLVWGRHSAQFCRLEPTQRPVPTYTWLWTPGLSPPSPCCVSALLLMGGHLACPLLQAVVEHSSSCVRAFQSARVGASVADTRGGMARVKKHVHLPCGRYWQTAFQKEKYQCPCGKVTFLYICWSGVGLILTPQKSKGMGIL